MDFTCKPTVYTGNGNQSPKKSSSTTTCMGDYGKTEEQSKLENEIEIHFTRLIDIILTDDNVPKNILLVGRPSAGKSSFINLLKSSLVGYYTVVAQPGSSHSGAVSQFTDQLTKYPNLGLNEGEMTNLKDRITQSKRHVPSGFRLPTFIDIPGIENDPKFLLDLILDGLVPDRTPLTSSMQCNGTPVTDYKCAPHNRIDLIVFVASNSQDVPVELFEKVFDLGCRKKHIPYTLIMTHSDSDLSTCTIEARRKQIEDVLCISQDSVGMTSLISNYNCRDPIDPEKMIYRVNLKKHKTALMALQMMVRWRLPRPPPKHIDELDVSFRILKHNVPKILEYRNVLGRLPVIIAIVFLIVSIILCEWIRRMH